MNYYLAIDQGGHASRAIVFDQQANIISQAEHAIHTFIPKPDRVEHDAQEMIHATRQAIIDAIAQLGEEKKQLKAAGLATQRSSIACWNKHTGEALSPILSWQDRRQADWLEQFQNQGNCIHEKTGLFLSPHYGASKLRWCLDNLDTVRLAQKSNQLVMGPLASFLAFHLLREHPLLADPANASRTLLWNINTHSWDDELLQLFGIERSLLPPCGFSTGDFGHIALDDLSIPLRIITGDQSAALFAWGVPQTDTAYINIGTGAFVQRPLAKPINTDRLLNGMAYLDTALACYTLEGTVNGAARALQWYAELNDIENIELAVEQAIASNETPDLFINTVSGLGSPDWQANLEPRFIGCGGTDAQLLAILESISFLIQRNLDVMHQTTQKTTEIIISGGLSNLNALCQQLADLSGISVSRPAEHEATAKGLAYLIAARPANWPACSKIEKFMPNNNPTLHKRFQRWSRNLQQIIANNA